MSDFVALSCIRRPELLVDPIASGDLDRESRGGESVERARRALDGSTDENGPKRALRRLRQREVT